MSLRVKKIILTVLLLVVLVFAWICRSIGSNELAFLVLLPSLGVWIALDIKWWRCPSCGRYLGRFHFGAHHCQFCGSEIYDD